MGVAQDLEALAERVAALEAKPRPPSMKALETRIAALEKVASQGVKVTASSVWTAIAQLSDVDKKRLWKTLRDGK